MNLCSSPLPPKLFGKDWKPEPFVYVDNPPDSNRQLNWHLYGRSERDYTKRETVKPIWH